MSKIGKKPISIPEGVTVSLTGNLFVAKGPKGEQTVSLHPAVEVAIADGEVRLLVQAPQDRRQKALWGTYRSLLSNAITGVKDGFLKRLEISGVGFRAAVSGDKLNLNLGFSHPIEMAVPKGLEVKVEKNIITISGPDKQLVGEFAANVRAQRKPEPYKGKGIKYEGEVVRRKAGKVVKAVGA